MLKKRILALLLALTVLPTFAQASAVVFQQQEVAPINRRIERNTAKTLDYQPEAAKARTDTLVVGVTDLFGELNPFYVQSDGDDYAATLLYDELLFADNNGAIGAGVAAFETSLDGKTHTFTLQSGIAYADGEPLRSDDFINALYLLLMPGYDGVYDIARADIAGVAEYLAGDAGEIAGIQRISDTAFSVTLGAASPDALAYLAIPPLRMSLFGDLKRPSDTKNAETFYSESLERVRETDPSGMAFGQYLLSEEKVGEKATFVKNDAYWRGVPYIGTIELLVVPVGGELSAIMEGTVDIVSMLGSIEAVDTVADFETSFINLFTWDGDIIGYLGMDLSNELFADVNVRRALAMGFDREAARKNRIERYGNVPGMLLFDSFSPSALSASNELKEQFAYNPERAAELLGDAGWEVNEDGLRERDGTVFSFTLTYNAPNPVMEVVIPQMQMNFEQLGIEVKTEAIPFADLTERIDAGEYEMYFQARRLPMNAQLTSNLFVGGSHLNESGYSSDMMNRLLAMADSADDAARETVVYEMLFQELYLDMPMIPLYRRSEFLLTNARVMNVMVTTAHSLLADAYRFFFTDTLEAQW